MTCRGSIKVQINRMNPRVWLLIVFLMSRIGFSKAAGQCRPSESSVYGMFLKGHTFKTIQARIPAACQMKCNEEARCQSFNVILGANICELNSRTKEARPEDMVRDLDRIYMKRAYNRGTGSILPCLKDCAFFCYCAYVLCIVEMAVETRIS